MNKTNILIFGEGGTGKSTSIASIFKLLDRNPEIKIRYLMTETNAMDGMRDGMKLHNIKLKPGQLSYMVCKPDKIKRVTSAQIAREYRENFTKLSGAESKKVKIKTGDRAKRIDFYTVLVGLSSFKGTDYCTREITDYGDYLTWDKNIIFVIDSLTAIIDHLIDEVKASRISTIIADYMDVQNNLMSKIVVPLTEDSECSVIMLGHPVIGDDNTVKQPTGIENQDKRITKLYPKTFGQALNGMIISKFTETIYCYVDSMDNFYFAGKKSGVATSPRRFPRKDKLLQDLSLYEIFGI